MARSTAKRSRARGAVDALPSGALRVRVYAGEDPLTGKRHDLIEVIPPGPQAAAQAEAARVRLLTEVDERRNPRTKATVDQLLDLYLDNLDVGRSTHRMYTDYLRKHVRPFIGHLRAGAVDNEVLDSLYRELRRCRTHCTDRKGTDHRTPLEHECDERCRPHQCLPLSSTTVRHVHFVLRGAFERGVRWRWLGVNPVQFASPPAAKRPDPRPPSAEEAARIIEAAWESPDWGALVWLTMTTGARRGELCGLRWSHVDLPSGVLTYRRAIAQDGRHREEKDTKTHQQRRVTLDPETVAVLTEHRARCQERAASAGMTLTREAFVFSRLPGGRAHLVPSSVTQRYGRLVRRLGIDTHLHNLRHYSATELIAAGVDVRTVAGRLRHSGGGLTTLRVYAAWLAEADQRAAGGLLARMPERPAAVPLVKRALTSPRTPRELIAAALHTQIVAGEFPDGAHLPGIKELAVQHGVAVSTVHRAFALLRTWGVLEGDPRERPTVRTPATETPEEIHSAPPPVSVAGRRMLEFRLRSAGREVAAFSAEADPDSAADLGPLLRSAVRRTAGPEAEVGDYESEVLADGSVLRTFVMAC
jgi:integrase